MSTNKKYVSVLLVMVLLFVTLVTPYASALGPEETVLSNMLTGQSTYQGAAAVVGQGATATTVKAAASMALPLLTSNGINGYLNESQAASMGANWLMSLDEPTRKAFIDRVAASNTGYVDLSDLVAAIASALYYDVLNQSLPSTHSYNAQSIYPAWPPFLSVYSWEFRGLGTLDNPRRFSPSHILQGNAYGFNFSGEGVSFRTWVYGLDSWVDDTAEVKIDGVTRGYITFYRKGANIYTGSLGDWYTFSGLRAGEHQILFIPATSLKYQLYTDINIISGDTYTGPKIKYANEAFVPSYVEVAADPLRPPRPPVDPAQTVNGPPQDSGSGVKGEPVNTSSGNFFYDKKDLGFANPHTPLAFNRYYNSKDPYAGPLGKGWTYSFNARLTPSPDSSVVITRENGRYDVFKKNPDGSYTAPIGVYSTLAKGSDGNYALKEKGGAKLNFSAEGKLTSIADKNGNATLLSYTGGLLSTVTDSAGRKLTLNYDAGKHLVKVSDSTGREITYTYNTSGDLIGAKDPEGNTTRYSYDPAHRLTSYTEPEGNAFITNTYDEKGRVTKQVNALGEDILFAYDEANRQTTIKDASGATTVHHYNEALRLTKEVDPLGREKSYTYDAKGNRISITDQKGNKTALSYDARGNLTAVKDALENTATFTYNQSDNLTAITDASGALYRFAYDETGNLTSIEDPKGARSDFSYNADGTVKALTDAKGAQTTFTYDMEKNLVKVVDRAGSSYAFSYDAIGRLRKATDPLGDSTSLTYNANGKPLSVANALDETVSYSYDKNQNVIAVTDPKAGKTAYAYDALNRLTEATDSLGRKTSYAYDSDWNLTAVTDAAGHKSEYTYDMIGNLINVKNPLGVETKMEYDATGNRVATTDGAGKKSSYEYDALGRLVNIAYADGRSVGLTYDAMGRLTKMNDWNGITSYVYDPLGKLTTVTDPKGRKTSYAYDILGNRASITYPDGKTVSYDYDSASRLDKVTDFLGGKSSYAYDPAGRLIEQILPNGVKTGYTYDAAGRVKSLTSTAGSKKDDKSLSSFAYAYDANGNRISEQRGDDDPLSYAYDPLNQLTSVSLKEANRTYAYDERGNRISLVESKLKEKEDKDEGKGKGVDNDKDKGRAKAEGEAKAKVEKKATDEKQAKDEKQDKDEEKSTKQTAYRYNGANQLIEMVGPNGKKTAFSYDGSGNLVLKSVAESDEETKITHYTYDSTNRLAKVEIAEEDETRTVEYAYDGLGNRIGRTEYEIEEGVMSEKKTVEYINDPSSPITQVLQAVDESGKTDTLTYGLQRISKVNDESKADYYLYDGLGSVTGLTNEKGSLTAKYSYNEFGIPSTSSKFGQGGERSNTYGYTGEDFDQTTGLLYLRARYYSADIGRFISQDPLPGNLIAPRTQNRYAYVLNNPLSYIDRLGLGPKGGTGATTFFNAWKIMLGEVSLEAWISGTVSGSKDIKILYGLWDITLETPLASYGIDKTGGFSVTPNTNVSNSIFTNHWSVTTGNVPGDWIRSYYMTLTRTVSFRQGSLDIDYKANFTFSLGTPGPYLFAAAVVTLAVTYLGIEVAPLVIDALNKLLATNPT